ncbi:hypothetical protein H261_11954 [Paramagnetospirillum caucaseum]|uniref:Uncharacterized protein n=1 Tax=Paramagnetospirillum caucaseum TaxID=1244869 RepID=M2ZR01_9PROT|nr:hypothetical protein [Paramagnetospirillum caucaseum]EME69747.1 hypothetical protein H261_11954 [Paramagnetospirillum caucaseum]
MTDTCTMLLDELLATAQTWLKPTIDAECRRQDAAKLRAFVTNLQDVRDLVHLMEEGLVADPADSLAATMEGLAQSFAAIPDGATLSRAARLTFIAIFNEAASRAWAWEVALRLHADIIATTDIETLALARKLRLGAVTRASALGFGPQPPERGGAA